MAANPNQSDLLDRLDGLTEIELAVLDGLTTLQAELELLDNQPASVVFVVGSDAGTTVEVNGQVKDAAGADMATPTALEWYYSTDALGLVPMTTPHDGGSAAGTDGKLIENVDNLSGKLVTEADGDFDIIATDAGAFTSYLVIVMPNGSLQISTVMTHDA